MDQQKKQILNYIRSNQPVGKVSRDNYHSQDFIEKTVKEIYRKAFVYNKETNAR